MQLAASSLYQLYNLWCSKDFEQAELTAPSIVGKKTCPNPVSLNFVSYLLYINKSEGFGGGVSEIGHLGIANHLV